MTEIDLACPCCGYKPEPKPSGPTLDDAQKLVEQVARRHQIPLRELLSNDRSRRLVLPRWQAYSELRRIGFNYTKIGEIMNRDRTTVMHGVLKMAESDDRND